MEHTEVTRPAGSPAQTPAPTQPVIGKPGSTPPKKIPVVAWVVCGALLAGILIGLALWFTMDRRPKPVPQKATGAATPAAELTTQTVATDCYSYRIPVKSTGDTGTSCSSVLTYDDVDDYPAVTVLASLPEEDLTAMLVIAQQALNVTSSENTRIGGVEALKVHFLDAKNIKRIVYLVNDAKGKFQAFQITGYDDGKELEATLNAAIDSWQWKAN